jgi:microcystin-dependent protein
MDDNDHGPETANYVENSPRVLPDRRQVIGGAAGTLAYLMSLGATRAQFASTPFIGSIMTVAFNYAPKGWAFCDGQTLAINQNQALFALLGTNFGGNGVQTFALPDLRGRTPFGAVSGTPGAKYGEESHTIVGTEMPAHAHLFNANSNIAGSGRGKTIFAAGNYFGGSNNSSATIYGQAGAAVPLTGNVGATGGGQAHGNIQPSLGLNFVIALSGIFPSRN